MDKPVFQQIADDFKKQINDGQLTDGHRLPSERELAESYRVSRMTVRHAIEKLVEDGFVQKRAGAGTFVVPKPVGENLIGLTSFSQLMKQQGRKPGSKILGYIVEEPTKNQAKKLNLPYGEEVVIIDRIRTADDLPIAYEEAIIPARYMKGINKNDINKSLYEALSKNGLNLETASFKQEFYARKSPKAIADILQMKNGDPVLYLEQISTLESDDIFEYTRAFYYGERYNIFLERKGF